MGPELEKKDREPVPASGPVHRDRKLESSRRGRLREAIAPLSYSEQVSLLSPREKPGGLSEGEASAEPTVSAGPDGIEFLLAWNSQADLTKVLAFSTPGITAFGVALACELATGRSDHLKGYPNLTAEQWKWIREVGHPFAIGNYWEQNSAGKPLVFTNIYGHGTLGILNMTVADALFPNSPLLALVAASLMYTNFELFGEGSIKAPYEPNDFFISHVIPMAGSQAVADLLHLDQKIPMSVVASAQALVYALCSGSKMSKTDWLALAGYPVLMRLVEISPLFKGRSRLLEQAFEHIATVFGFSEGMGPYTGVAYRDKVGESDLTLGVGIGPGGQRVSASVSGERVAASAYAERSYSGPGGQPDYRVGANLSVRLGETRSAEDVAHAREALKRDVRGFLGAMKGRADRAETLKALAEVERELLAAAERCRDASLANEVRSALWQAASLFQRDESGRQTALALLRTLPGRIP